MVRGTTPTHTFALPVEASRLDKCYITYTQDGETVLEKSLNQLTQSGNTVSFKMTQAESLLFNSDVVTEIQMAIEVDDDVYRSDIHHVDTLRILKDEEI